MKTKLFKFQQKIVNKMLTGKVTTLAIPTGSGKLYIMLAIAEAQPDKQHVWYVPVSLCQMYEQAILKEEIKNITLIAT